MKSYLKWSRAQQDISLALETHKPVIALLFDKTSWPVDNDFENKLKSHAICLDFDAGCGEALSHQFDQGQLNKLVTQCNGLLYGTGDIHPPEPPVSPDSAFHIQNEGNLGIVRRQSSLPLNQKEGTRKTSLKNCEVSKDQEKQVEILELSKPLTTDIVESKESEEIQVQRMAASAVAAAVAGATAQHISKTDNSPAAVKAAAAAAEVAQAVVDGNSDAAAKAVVKVAKIVEENSKNHSHSKQMSNGSVSVPPQSSTCTIL